MKAQEFFSFLFQYIVCILRFHLDQLVCPADVNKNAIRETGGIPVLVALLKRKEAAVLKPAAKAIWNIVGCSGAATLRVQLAFF